ncbi:hypothetical protein AUEXF2481DRAFT_44935 [Aureobasidium subglaciale EXF-2481]|uniref:Uncharacterized protein n=1 Tax=Aureobasidium subglaciale (strain EXF-2481) TaxID=1043005 RepID=A0A074XYJ9_AURSE|nr:uncharacterized protein AUEXF2481DRAFT_44935 [Aureobasidium subglaciale EXF-2481]KEQ90603.1 hypothetical protein AUEXF2481DRAFT_44935 [Aureobasidium subglaciale EXF-2481]
MRCVAVEVHFHSNTSSSGVLSWRHVFVLVVVVVVLFIPITSAPQAHHPTSHHTS